MEEEALKGSRHPAPSVVIPEAASRHTGIGEPRTPPWLSDPGSPLRCGRDDDGEADGKPGNSAPARPRVPDLIRDPSGGVACSGREEEIAPSAGCHAGFRLTSADAPGVRKTRIPMWPEILGSSPGDDVEEKSRSVKLKRRAF